MANYTVYEAATGKILRHGTCPESDAPLQAIRPGEAVVLEPSGFDKYVSDGLILDRPALEYEDHVAAIGADVIYELPIGTVVYVDGEEVATTDSAELTLVFPIAAEWEISAEPPFPWIEKSWKVTSE